VFHELATNAAKYGALLRDEGRVSVSWGREGETLALQWRESGGPAIAAEPMREGFGSTLARDTILRHLGGTFTLNWQAQGLVAEFVLPLAKLTR
jgi:two-component sensor histidine kinase